MLATVGVNAALSQPQALDGTVSYDVRLDDLGDVRHLHVSIPDALGIYHYGWTVLALVEASGFVGADGVLQSEKGKMGLESPLEFGRAVGITASTGMSFGTLVAAYENVFCEFSHGIKLIEPCR
jgi:hypothetical protein